MANKHSKQWTLAACTVAVAAAVSGIPLAGETQAVEQLQRYCTTSWRNAGIDRQDWPDCTQQALTELLERVDRDGLVEAIQTTDSPQRRELNRSVWRTIQRWRRSPRSVPYVDSAQPTEAECPSEQREGWEGVAEMARSCLSSRQQRILALTRDGWKVNEIAGQLDLAPARVSDEKYKAIRKLRQQLVA